MRGRLRHDGPPAAVETRVWPLRVSDFDVLAHVNNARSLEAIEDELVARLPGWVPVGLSVEYRGTLERGDVVRLASEVRTTPAGETELAAWMLVDDDVRISARVRVLGEDEARPA